MAGPWRLQGSIVANGISRTAFQGRLCFTDFFWRHRLPEDYGHANLRVTLEEVRGRSPALVAVYAADVHVEGTGEVLRESIR